MRRTVATAIAVQLSSMGRTRRAIDWYRKLHADDPNDAQVAVDLVNILGHQKEWGEAAIVLKKQLDLSGERPGVLFAYGRALFEAGDFNGAIDALTRSLKLGGGNEATVTQHASRPRIRAGRKGNAARAAETRNGSGQSQGI
jgi:Flp pilus assembly protein TadD